MNKELEDLQITLKSTYSYKYKPEYSESFKTEIKDNQIIPLIIEVCEKLEWIIVFSDKNSVEAKRQNNWNKLTEKITITKKASGRVEVHSKTIEGNFIDFGKNSLRTGLFIALFQKLESEYEANGKLVELGTKYEEENNWAHYEIPLELPKPIAYEEPNLTITIIGGLLISTLAGSLLGFLTIKFVYIIGLYEFGIGFGIGYLFSKLIRKTKYMEFRELQFIIGGMILLMFVTNLYTQYILITVENNIYGFTFIDFIKLKFEYGLTIKELNTGWIGLVISWVLQIVIPYIVANAHVAGSSAKYIIEKIPEEVVLYTIYLFDMDKSESEVRAELANKGWNKKKDQDDVLQAIAEIQGFQQMNRE